MRTLNDPVEYEDTAGEEWTPAIGFRRALKRGPLVTLLLAVLLAPLSQAAPMLYHAGVLRAVLTLVVAWVIFRTAQAAAGMAGWRLSILACGLTFLVFALQHLIYAVRGAPLLSDGQELTAWQWLSPGVLLALNLVTVGMLPFCVLLFHRGSISGGLGVLADVLMMGIWGSSRK